MSYLKPIVALVTFKPESNFIDKLDVKTLVSCLSIGNYAKPGMSRLNKYKFNSYSKCAYDSLPKAIKYNVAEGTFDSIEFRYVSFYEHNVDIIQVYVDYCEEILKLYPDAKKVNRFYKELKKEHPEYFL